MGPTRWPGTWSKRGSPPAAIHGNKSQTARQQALSDFKAGRIQCLVATDIAARGLDIEELSHVFNYDLPEVPETYVHRIGRTGRAGREGMAVALCDFSEKPLLKDIEKLMDERSLWWRTTPWPMKVFEAPKRDKNGKPINAEDAEARPLPKTAAGCGTRARRRPSSAKRPRPSRRARRQESRRKSVPAPAAGRKRPVSLKGCPPTPHLPPSRITKVPSAAPNHPSEEYVPAR